MKTLRGTPASRGVASGPWVRVEATALPAGGMIDPRDAVGEVARLAAASRAAAASLDEQADQAAAASLADESGIFAAHAAMARDPMLTELARGRIAAGQDAVAAIGGAATEIAAQLGAIDDEILAARAADVLDVARRIIGLLDPAAAPAPPTLDRPSIVVARDLAPSVTAALPRTRLLGIALEQGSPSAHAAILARGYGIPAVVGVDGLLAALADEGEPTIAIDGSSGVLTIGPDAAADADLAVRAAADRRRRDDEQAAASLPAVTTDGTEITLLANIGLPAEAAGARALGARGVGLFRTEFLFIERADPPTEDEQVAAYREVLDAFGPLPVIVRLLDVGGDKPMPFLRLPHEANPFLGVRALRLADVRPELFVTQLRAAMRAAAGRAPGSVKVMAPMVADGTDADLLFRLAADAAATLRRDGLPFGEPALGVMLEIPSAILTAPAFFEQIAFASIGSNDLAQYTLAADRGNPRLARFHDALHPAVLQLIAQAVDAADRARIELSVCGEMAGDPVAALALVGLGVRRLSMAPSSLGGVRAAIRGTSRLEVQGQAAVALLARDAQQVRERFAPLAPATAGLEAARTDFGASTPASAQADGQAEAQADGQAAGQAAGGSPKPEAISA